MNQPLDPSPIGAPEVPSTYPESVSRPTDRPQPQPQAPRAEVSDARPEQPESRPEVSDARPERSWVSRLGHNLGRDTVLVLPGFFISLIGFVVLITLFSVAIPTLIIWVGALLLPLTLVVASGFANLSRARARQWGAPVAEAALRPRRRGFRGWLGVMAEGRRWLDLLFETVFALPIRILTFSVSVAWFFGALGGLTFFFWGRFLPPDDIDLIDYITAWVTNSPVADLGFGAEASFQFGTGLILLLTFPFVLHALALLEIAAIQAGLAGKAPAGDGSGLDPGRTATASGGAASKGSDPSPEPGFFSNAGVDGWFWLFASFVAVVLVAVSWPVTTVAYDVPTVPAMLLALGQSAALVVAVRWPVPAIVLGWAASAAGIVLTAQSSGLVWPWTVTAILALLFLHLIIGLRHKWFHLACLWVLTAALGLLSLLLPHAGGLPGALANAITTVSLAAGVSIIAVIGHLWIRGRSQLATERQLSAEELAKRQELEERNRIAQELHDVVAHSMSVISVQATTARYRLPDLDGRSLEEFDSIAGSARQALTEMRGLLAILRGGRDADLAPQPTVEDIPALVASTRGSGAEVELEFAVESAGISPTAGLTAFRVVQESLSNALRHSAGAPVTVTVTSLGTRLEIVVLNGEPDGRSDAGGHSHLGGGFGIKGMRERVEALGGSLQVGPTEARGFEVRASLPMD